MSSKGALKWLERLKRPRSLESLISEVYGEAAWFGCLFEREVADILNFLDLASDPIASLTRKPFDTQDWTLNQLVKEVKKRGILSDGHAAILDDGREARNELVHRLVATDLVVSTADKEILLAKIDGLYLRVWNAHRLASGIKKQLAERVGFTEAKASEAVRKLKDEARIEDENVRRILGLDENEPKG